MVGTTIQDFVLTQWIGDGPYEEYYFAMHEARHVPAQVRRCKQEYLSDSEIRTRYVQLLRQEMEEAGLRENEDYFLVNKEAECALIKIVQAEEWGNRSALWLGFHEAGAPQQARFHREVERVAMFTMPLGLLLGHAALGLATFMCIDGYRPFQLVLGLFGVASIGAAVGGAGLLQRRLWGLRLSRISYVATLFSVLLLILSRKQHFPQWMAETMSEKIEVHFPWMVILLVIVGLALASDVVFSRRARHYFENPMH